MANEVRLCTTSPIWYYVNETETKLMILNCRLICLAWRNAVGELAQVTDADEWQYFLEPNYTINYRVSRLLRNSYKFFSILKTEKFLELFGKHSSNPFVGRTITILPTPLDVPNRGFGLYHSLTTTFMQSFGPHISQCEFAHIINRTANEEEQIYYKLVEWLGNTQNLRHLCITFSGLNGRYYPPDLTALPKLTNLETLVLGGVSGSFAYAIVGNNLHISKLSMVSSLRNFNCDDFQYGPGKLKYLELTVWVCELKNFVVPRWPFNKLKLNIVPVAVTGYIGRFVPWCEIFGFLQTKFGTIVDELDINFTSTDSPSKLHTLLKDSLTCRFNFTKIKKLDLGIENLCVFDFLLGIKDTLELLSITWKGRHMENNMGSGYYKEAKRIQHLQILGFEQNLYESNIWDLFPKLEVVHFTCQNLFSHTYQKRFRPVPGMKCCKRKGKKILK